MLDSLSTRGQHWLSPVYQLKGSPEVPDVTFSTDSLSTNGDSGVIPILLPRSWNAVQWCHRHLLLPVIANFVPRRMWCCRWWSEGALSTNTDDCLHAHFLKKSDHRHYGIPLYSAQAVCLLVLWTSVPPLAQPNSQKSCDWKYTELSADIAYILFAWCMAGPWYHLFGSRIMMSLGKIKAVCICRTFVNGCTCA